MELPRPFTYRLQNVPGDTSEEQLLKYFVHKDRSGIKVRSLCPSVDSLSDTLTATIAFSVDGGESPRQPELLDPDESEIDIDDNFYGLTPLNSPEQPILADVIAVTGLAGHAFGSWACSPHQMWLRDFLPKDLKNIRVLIYGYNSQLREAHSRSLLGDHVRMFKQRLLTLSPSDRVQHRPIIFIGHSLGCLLIKKALVEIIGSPTARHISNFPLIIFLAAPHRGLSVVSLQTILAVENPSKDIVDELGESSSTLTDLNENFAKIAHALNILSCYELQKTKTLVTDSEGNWHREGPPTMMVSQNSAMLHSANEDRVPCDADHSKIAKLRRTEASLYPTLKTKILQVLERHSDSESSSFGDQRSNFGEEIRRPSPGPSPALEGHTLRSGPQSLILPPPREFNIEHRQITATPSPSQEVQQDTIHLNTPATSAPNRHAGQRPPLVSSPLPDIGPPRVPMDFQFASRSQSGYLPRMSPNLAPEDAPRPQEAELLGGSEEKQTAGTDAVDLRQSLSPKQGIENSINQTEKQVVTDETGADTSPGEIRSRRSRSLSGLLHLSHEFRRRESASHDDRNASESDSHSPSSNGASSPQSSIKRYSLKFLDRLHVGTPKGEKPEPHEILKAAAENNLDLLRDLIERGADVDSRIAQAGNRTALHEAAMHNCLEVAEYLVTKGAKKEARSKTKATPLHEAASAGSNDVANLLILTGAPLEAKNSEDETPLSVASKRGHLEIAKNLLDHDADFDAQREDGKTALQIAEAGGFKDICRVLRAKGARLPRKNTTTEQAPQWPGLF
ncbi:MAG: hypothetical protein Q9165_004796 [Trypethelium subeluteriae]